MPKDRSYEDKVLAAFMKLCETQDGASAFEVLRYMEAAGELAALDTVIDIADIMQKLADQGRIPQRAGR